MLLRLYLKNLTNNEAEFKTAFFALKEIRVVVMMKLV